MPSTLSKVLSTRSKNIQKSAAASTPMSEKEQKSKKYQTFDASEKEMILSDLKKALIQALGVEKPTFGHLFTADLFNLIAKLRLEDYNKILAKILKKHVGAFDGSTKAFTQWRKKVKGWIENMGKPETRGGLVVAHEKKEIFYSRVVTILKNLPYRGFKLLQEQILVVLEEFHLKKQDQLNPEPFDKKTCSKHWWFNFMEENPEIKETWKNIPLEKSLKKLKASSQGSLESKFGSETGPSTPENDNMVSIQGVEELKMRCQMKYVDMLSTTDETASQNFSSVVDENKTYEGSLPVIELHQKSSVYLSSMEEDQEDRVKDLFGQLYTNGFNRNDEENDDSSFLRCSAVQEEF